MHHKLYKAIEDIVLNTTLSGLIEIDAQYTKINLKGTKPNKMPRHSKKHGISTRHLQDYLNWLLFLKKIKYKVKAEARVSFTYIESMKQVHTIVVRNITKLPMPIDLYQAYEEYHFGIYS